MKNRLIMGTLIFAFATTLFTGCASKINNSQANELKSYKAKGLYVEEKSVGTAIGLGLLPGGGSFYTEHYGLGIVNLLVWPWSILWDPISGANGAESINYYATKHKAVVDKRDKLVMLERELEDGKIDNNKFIRERREIEDFYDPNY